ncbi:hypothetical protein OG417_53825 [Actinoallomurus sp. NBC_01490]|uniref:hypothetical protein n=1 Tax=Actinoallomurus sp. NBC_01490 TaxID=2903557 RepID=UPI002E369C6C|nr:hypothetical protein [Actinoallomurus sp. NBC_01490]
MNERIKPLRDAAQKFRDFADTIDPHTKTANDYVTNDLKVWKGDARNAFVTQWLDYFGGIDAGNWKPALPELKKMSLDTAKAIDDLAEAVGSFLYTRKLIEDIDTFVTWGSVFIAVASLGIGLLAGGLVDIAVQAGLQVLKTTALGILKNAVFAIAKSFTLNALKQLITRAFLGALVGGITDLAIQGLKQATWYVNYTVPLNGKYDDYVPDQYKFNLAEVFESAGTMALTEGLLHFTSPAVKSILKDTGIEKTKWLSTLISHFWAGLTGGGADTIFQAGRNFNAAVNGNPQQGWNWEEFWLNVGMGTGMDLPHGPAAPHGDILTVHGPGDRTYTFNIHGDDYRFVDPNTGKEIGTGILDNSYAGEPRIHVTFDDAKMTWPEYKTPGSFDIGLNGSKVDVVTHQIQMAGVENPKTGVVSPQKVITETHASYQVLADGTTVRTGQVETYSHGAIRAIDGSGHPVETQFFTQEPLRVDPSTGQIITGPRLPSIDAPGEVVIPRESTISIDEAGRVTHAMTPGWDGTHATLYAFGEDGRFGTYGIAHRGPDGKVVIDPPERRSGEQPVGIDVDDPNAANGKSPAISDTGLVTDAQGKALFQITTEGNVSNIRLAVPDPAQIKHATVAPGEILGKGGDASSPAASKLPRLITGAHSAGLRAAVDAIDAARRGEKAHFTIDVPGSQDGVRVDVSVDPATGAVRLKLSADGLGGLDRRAVTRAVETALHEMADASGTPLHVDTGGVLDVPRNGSDLVFHSSGDRPAAVYHVLESIKSAVESGEQRLTLNLGDDIRVEFTTRVENAGTRGETVRLTDVAALRGTEPLPAHQVTPLLEPALKDVAEFTGRTVEFDEGAGHVAVSRPSDVGRSGPHYDTIGFSPLDTGAPPVITKVPSGTPLPGWDAPWSTAFASGAETLPEISVTVRHGAGYETIRLTGEVDREAGEIHARFAGDLADVAAALSRPELRGAILTGFDGILSGFAETLGFRVVLDPSGLERHFRGAVYEPVGGVRGMTEHGPIALEREEVAEYVAAVQQTGGRIEPFTFPIEHEGTVVMINVAGEIDTATGKVLLLLSAGDGAGSLAHMPQDVVMSQVKEAVGDIADRVATREPEAVRIAMEPRLGAILAPEDAAARVYRLTDEDVRRMILVDFEVGKPTTVEINEPGEAAYRVTWTSRMERGARGDARLVLEDPVVEKATPEGHHVVPLESLPEAQKIREAIVQKLREISGLDVEVRVADAVSVPEEAPKVVPRMADEIEKSASAPNEGFVEQVENNAEKTPAVVPEAGGGGNEKPPKPPEVDVEEQPSVDRQDNSGGQEESKRPPEVELARRQAELEIEEERLKKELAKEQADINAQLSSEQAKIASETARKLEEIRRLGEERLAESKAREAEDQAAVEAIEKEIAELNAKIEELQGTGVAEQAKVSPLPAPDSYVSVEPEPPHPAVSDEVHKSREFPPDEQQDIASEAEAEEHQEPVESEPQKSVQADEPVEQTPGENEGQYYHWVAKDGDLKFEGTGGGLTHANEHIEGNAAHPADVPRTRSDVQHASPTPKPRAVPELAAEIERQQRHLETLQSKIEELGLRPINRISAAIDFAWRLTRTYEEHLTELRNALNAFDEEAGRVPRPGREDVPHEMRMRRDRLDRLVAQGQKHADELFRLEAMVDRAKSRLELSDELKADIAAVDELFADFQDPAELPAADRARLEAMKASVVDALMVHDYITGHELGRLVRGEDGEFLLRETDPAPLADQQARRLETKVRELRSELAEAQAADDARRIVAVEKRLRKAEAELIVALDREHGERMKMKLHELMTGREPGADDYRRARASRLSAAEQRVRDLRSELGDLDARIGRSEGETRRTLIDQREAKLAALKTALVERERYERAERRYYQHNPRLLEIEPEVVDEEISRLERAMAEAQGRRDHVAVNSLADDVARLTDRRDWLIRRRAVNHLRSHIDALRRPIRAYENWIEEARVKVADARQAFDNAAAEGRAADVAKLETPLRKATEELRRREREAATAVPELERQIEPRVDELETAIKKVLGARRALRPVRAELTRIGDVEARLLETGEAAQLERRYAKARYKLVDALRKLESDGWTSFGQEMLERAVSDDAALNTLVEKAMSIGDAEVIKKEVGVHGPADVRGPAPEPDPYDRSVKAAMASLSKADRKIALQTRLQEKADRLTEAGSPKAGRLRDRARALQPAIDRLLGSADQVSRSLKGAEHDLYKLDLDFMRAVLDDAPVLEGNWTGDIAEMARSHVSGRFGATLADRMDLEVRTRQHQTYIALLSETREETARLEELRATRPAGSNALRAQTERVASLHRLLDHWSTGDDGSPTLHAAGGRERLAAYLGETMSADHRPFGTDLWSDTVRLARRVLQGKHVVIDPLGDPRTWGDQVKITELDVPVTKKIHLTHREAIRDWLTGRQPWPDIVGGRLPVDSKILDRRFVVETPDGVRLEVSVYKHQALMIDSGLLTEGRHSMLRIDGGLADGKIPYWAMTGPHTAFELGPLTVKLGLSYGPHLDLQYIPALRRDFYLFDQVGRETVEVKKLADPYESGLPKRWSYEKPAIGLRPADDVQKTEQFYVKWGIQGQAVPIVQLAPTIHGIAPMDRPTLIQFGGVGVIQLTGEVAHLGDRIDWTAGFEGLIGTFVSLPYDINGFPLQPPTKWFLGWDSSWGTVPWNRVLTFDVKPYVEHYGPRLLSRLPFGLGDGFRARLDAVEAAGKAAEAAKEAERARIQGLLDALKRPENISVASSSLEQGEHFEVGPQEPAVPRGRAMVTGPLSEAEFVPGEKGPMTDLNGSDISKVRPTTPDHPVHPAVVDLSERKTLGRVQVDESKATPLRGVDLANGAKIERRHPPGGFHLTGPELEKYARIMVDRMYHPEKYSGEGAVFVRPATATEPAKIIVAENAGSSVVRPPEGWVVLMHHHPYGHAGGRLPSSADVFSTRYTAQNFLYVIHHASKDPNHRAMFVRITREAPEFNWPHDMIEELVVPSVDPLYSDALVARQADVDIRADVDFADVVDDVEELLASSHIDPAVARERFHALLDATGEIVDRSPYAVREHTLLDGLRADVDRLTTAGHLSEHDVESLRQVMNEVRRAGVRTANVHKLNVDVTHPGTLARAEDARDYVAWLREEQVPRRIANAMGEDKIKFRLKGQDTGLLGMRLTRNIRIVIDQAIRRLSQRVDLNIYTPAEVSRLNALGKALEEYRTHWEDTEYALEAVYLDRLKPDNQVVYPPSAEAIARVERLHADLTSLHDVLDEWRAELASGESHALQPIDSAPSRSANDWTKPMTERAKDLPDVEDDAFAVAEHEAAGASEGPLRVEPIAETSFSELPERYAAAFADPHLAARHGALMDMLRAIENEYARTGDVGQRDQALVAWRTMAEDLEKALRSPVAGLYERHAALFAADEAVCARLSALHQDYEAIHAAYEENSLGRAEALAGWHARADALVAELKSRAPAEEKAIIQATPGGKGGLPKYPGAQRWSRNNGLTPRSPKVTGPLDPFGDGKPLPPGDYGPNNPPPGDVYPDLPWQAPGEIVDMPDVDPSAVLRTDSPEFERLWKALWQLNLQTHLEHNVVELHDGSFHIVKAGKYAMLDTPSLGIERVWMHVHPHWLAAGGPSLGDLRVLGMSPGQTKAILIENGLLPYEYEVPPEVRAALGLPAISQTVDFISRIDALRHLLTLPDDEFAVPLPELVAALTEHHASLPPDPTRAGLIGALADVVDSLGEAPSPELRAALREGLDALEANVRGNPASPLVDPLSPHVHPSLGDRLKADFLRLTSRRSAELRDPYLRELYDRLEERLSAIEAEHDLSEYVGQRSGSLGAAMTAWRGEAEFLQEMLDSPIARHWDRYESVLLENTRLRARLKSLHVNYESLINAVHGEEVRRDIDPMNGESPKLWHDQVRRLTAELRARSGEVNVPKRSRLPLIDEIRDRVVRSSSQALPERPVTRRLSLSELGLTDELDLTPHRDVPVVEDVANDLNPREVEAWDLDVDFVGGEEAIRSLLAEGTELTKKEWQHLLSRLNDEMANGKGWEYAGEIWPGDPGEALEVKTPELSLVEGGPEDVGTLPTSRVIIHSHPYAYSFADMVSAADFITMLDNPYSHEYVIEHATVSGEDRARILRYDRDGKVVEVLPSEVETPRLSEAYLPLLERLKEINRRISLLRSADVPIEGLPRRDATSGVPGAGDSLLVDLGIREADARDQRAVLAVLREIDSWGAAGEPDDLVVLATSRLDAGEPITDAEINALKRHFEKAENLFRAERRLLLGELETPARLSRAQVGLDYLERLMYNGHASALIREIVREERMGVGLHDYVCSFIVRSIKDAITEIPDTPEWSARGRRMVELRNRESEVMDLLDKLRSGEVLTPHETNLAVRVRDALRVAHDLFLFHRLPDVGEVAAS